MKSSSYLVDAGPRSSSLFIDPVVKGSVLLGPFPSNAPRNKTFWFVPQWNNPAPFSSPATTAFGSCVPPSATSDASLAVFVGTPAIRVCLFTAAGGSDIVELAATGAPAGGIPPLSCGAEYDTFLAPVGSDRTTRGGAPLTPNFSPVAASPTLSSLSSLSLTVSARLLRADVTPRCGPIGSCGPSGKLDFVYAVLGIVLHNVIASPPQTLFYQIILFDTRQSVAACSLENPCDPRPLRFFQTRLPTLGASDAIASFDASPCLQPAAPSATTYNLSLLPRISAALRVAATNFSADSNLSNWRVTSTYVGSGMQGSAMSALHLSDFDFTYALF